MSERADQDPGLPLTLIVIGGGTMGRGIAIAALARTPDRVVLVETDPERREELALGVISDATARGADDAPARFSVAGSLADAPVADLIVEAVPEIPELKHRVLREAEGQLAADGILCSNTSSLSIASLAGALARPERFLGMHFFQPVPDTVLTELILHPGVAGATVERAQLWTERLGREAITARDVPGFATSRLGLAIGLEAMRMLEEGVASAEDIDRGMRLGYQHAVGPLRMTDMVGLDVRLAIAEYLAAELGPRFEPPRIMRDMVAAGKLGRKSGQGFFTWPAEER
ncbi:3-hydroxyacyl-CoA dehydrogenase family protein [Leucobacter sp. CSA2]|uniref:3-hydroxyacyl-CoA dehydrogenase family protein n=1 Tax=Leucobacter edaphi TaxID=2796472 RepID=A0A934QCH1_9MICO|nr:3-hydroxyacyl-CoA dehydrogenase family protein [Leucobacter edaphi]MBK0421928.1 3-hydroxyacyl-CoA dehydrogenase family protein [Leucobacter edaphi]